MVIVSIGLGPLFLVLTIAAHNALPRMRLGIGTMANNTLASDRLPASIAQRLTPEGVKFATSPQALVNPAYRATVVSTAQHFAAQDAVAQVPSGP